MTKRQQVQALIQKIGETTNPKEIDQLKQQAITLIASQRGHSGGKQASRTVIRTGTR